MTPVSDKSTADPAPDGSAAPGCPPELLDLFDAQLESQKLDSMKELAYGASHEINNPLANIAARAQTLLRDEKDHQRRQALQSIHKQALRAHEMISDLMLFARPPEIIQEEIDLKELILRMLEEFSQECSQRQVQIHTELPEESVIISADAQQLSMALQTLCTNSLEAIGTSGTIWVTLKHFPKNEPLVEDSEPTEVPNSMNTGGVEICVTDDGPGLSEQALCHLFDPFYSGREAGRGLGFGLSKCWRIITGHGGSVKVTNRLEDPLSRQGTQFTMRLPAG